MISTLSSLLDAGVEMIEMNEKFEIRGVNHIAMVCADMARTVRFYRDVLGMQLVKTLDIPGGGQHFFLISGMMTALHFSGFQEHPHRNQVSRVLVGCLVEATLPLPTAQ